MLVFLHNTPLPSKKRLYYAICSNITTNIVESLPGIWGNCGKGGGGGDNGYFMS